jgi:hypothetical protein
VINGIVLKHNGGIPRVLKEKPVGELVGALEVHQVLHDQDKLTIDQDVAVLREANTTTTPTPMEEGRMWTRSPSMKRSERRACWSTVPGLGAAG